ncbi:LysR family transcriptional regulator, partial [Leucobacter sp. M11]|nr:LysR family transcriptional regulator [Leucobacter sp. M11]
GTLEVVLAGVGAALVPDPLARHLGMKGLRRVPVTGLPGTWIWACWLVEADGPVIQDFVGVLRGRTRSSSRHASER